MGGKFGDFYSRVSHSYTRRHQAQSHLLSQRLSYDLWILILEEVARIDGTLSSLRLVSRRHNEIVTPLLFRRCRIPITSSEDEHYSTLGHGFELVQKYARIIIVTKRRVNWDLAADFLSNCQQLREVKWNYPISHDDNFFPKPISRFFQQRPEIRMHLNANQNRAEALSSTTLTNHWLLDETVSRIPFSNLGSFIAFDHTTTIFLELLQTKLVQAKQLKSLGLYLPAVDDQFQENKFSPELGRLPPVETLDLTGTWSYESDDVEMIWDFSKIKTLKLIRELPNSLFIGICAREFVRCVPHHLLKGVKNLEITCLGEASRSQTEAFITQIESLESLRLRTSIPNEFVPCLAKHSDTLHTLELLELATVQPELGVGSLRSIQQSLINLAKLRINFDFTLPGGSRKIEPFRTALSIIASMVSLWKLSIYPQLTVPEKSLDHNKDFSDLVVGELRSKKVGKPFQAVDLHWRRWVRYVMDFESAPEWVQNRYRWDTYGQLTYSLILGEEDIP